METLEELGRYFEKTPVRQGILEKYIETLTPESKRAKLTKICQTR